MQASTGDRFTLRMPDLPAGPYRVQARATDIANNVSTTVDLDVRLREVILLTIDSPAQNAVVSSDRVDVIGTTKAFANVTLTALGRSYQARANADGSFRINTVALQEGANELRASARDDAGNDSQEIVRRITAQLPNRAVPVSLVSYLIMLLALLTLGNYAARRHHE
jgi:hypothetical protein